jgi:hypothetical protein
MKYPILIALPLMLTQAEAQTEVRPDEPFYGYLALYNGNIRDDLAQTDNKKLFSYTRNFDCMKPPISGVHIHDTLYSMLSDDPQSFYYYSGTKLTFDRNAFVYTDGTPYKGEVKLSYREFRNPIEIMLSGIPMTADVNGKQEVFKSGGMYQIGAFDMHGIQLKTKSDTSVKINFAMTDTASDFKFYTLDQKGNWTTVSNSVNVVSSSGGAKRTKAVGIYLDHMRRIRDIKPDTTNFYTRFYDEDYLYIYRKDNLIKNRDKLYYKYPVGFLGKRHKKTNALFKVKYYKQTKDKEIVFMLVPAHKDLQIPEHISVLLNREFLYTGSLNKQQFRETYNRKLLCWDLRNNSFDNSIDLVIKTDKSYITLSGTPVHLNEDKTYSVSKAEGVMANANIQRHLKREGKKFNRRGRFDANDKNGLGKRTELEQSQAAYELCSRYQTDNEKKMSFKEWRKYVKQFNPYQSWDELQNNDVGNALLKSGMGIKNIDCYLHSGAMEDIIVQYNISLDTVGSDYNFILYKNINTSYPMTRSFGNKGLSGYYLKKKDNYIVRFSEKGFMQVTKPADVENSKKGNNISLAHSDQHFVQGMNSDEISKLILDK